MRIAYIGRVSLQLLGKEMPFSPALPDAKWGFPVGSEVVLGFLRRGHVVSVITSDHRYKKSVCFRAKNCEVYILPERTTKLQFLTFFSREIRSIRLLLNLIKPDVVFAQWTYQNAYAGLTSGYPTLVVAHDSPWRVLKMYRNAFALIRAVYAQLFVFPRIEHMTTVSPHMVEDLRRLNRYRGEIKVIPNGIMVSGSKFQVPSFRSQVSGAGAGGKVVCKDAKTIVCVSQAGRLKNTLVLVKAFEILQPKHPEWRLLMLGQGLQDGIVPREERDRILREEADVFCSPSLEESFGMVFVEAMLQGVPCVGGEKSGAVPWVLGREGEASGRRFQVSREEEGSGFRFQVSRAEEVSGGEFQVSDRENGEMEVVEAGVLTDVTKPEVLARTLERVMLDYELRKRLSEAGIKRVKENFDVERVIDMYEKELKKVAKEG